MYTGNYVYHHDEQSLLGYLAYDDNKSGKRPAVLVVHDWSGRNEFACKKAEYLAELGYLGFAIDVYGEGRVGDSVEEKQGLMIPFVNDRLLLLKRLQAGLDAVLQLSEVDTSRVAVIGFCFGGLCALDLARSGADLKGAVSFHGLLNKPDGFKDAAIKASILALHGYDDPMVSPEQVNVFCDEMTEAGADWQVHMYGHTKHAFSNPNAHDESLGTIYDPKAEQRSLQAMKNFLAEQFK
jgi:dienelactone hydrolase